jgi:hypothetical protein
MLLNILGVDTNRISVPIRCGKGYVVKHPLHHRLQAGSANILDRRVYSDGNIGKSIDGIVGNVECDTFRLHQRDVLLDERGLGFGQDATHVIASQGFKLDANRQPSLQLGQQI